MEMNCDYACRYTLKLVCPTSLISMYQYPAILTEQARAIINRREI